MLDKNKILITGATGVLGSKLIRRLVQSGYNLICLKRNSSDLSNVIDLLDECEWVDYNEYCHLDNIFIDNNILGIIHTATAYGKISDDYFNVYDANMVLPYKLLELAHKYKVRYYISTGSFFDKELQERKKENERVYMDSYVKSKHVFEQIARDYVANMNLSFINMRLEHVYSAGDSRKFVNFVVSNILNNVPILNLTSGNQKRDWIYIDDVVSAYLKVLENINKFSLGCYYLVEVGTGKETSVKEIVEFVKKITKSNTELKFGDIKINQGELISSSANIAMLEELGWYPKFDIEAGILKVIEVESKT